MRRKNIRKERIVRFDAENIVAGDARRSTFLRSQSSPQICKLLQNARSGK